VYCTLLEPCANVHGHKGGVSVSEDGGWKGFYADAVLEAVSGLLADEVFTIARDYQ
jgi:hypothetical protein